MWFFLPTRLLCQGASSQKLPHSLQDEDLIDLCREVVKFGELAQSTYGALRTKNVYSDNFGTSRFTAEEFIKASEFLGYDAKRYKVGKPTTEAKLLSGFWCVTGQNQ